MDSKDRQILRALQRNGRMTNLELAEEVSLSPSPCLRRLRNLESSGAITGYSAKVDPNTYGLPITAFVHVRLKQHDDETVKQFENRIQQLDEVLECFMLTGGTDYFLKVMVSGLDAYEEFIRNKLHKINDIGSIDTSFIYSVVKQTNVFPL
ncbi:Lrp/AsnC family transcriptional regulator [Cohaesibacter gelatinilyticus]|uniref:Transcriptional regulator, AsnC family n=1 Tax=Cohaesibacter gelatinilyticus TaxID=372072 RepID=A0A285PJE5_9HYPH|nr:Lrp/AsnC family transcriptional regulator [Cohaesibacter gelatinilyticus]SNZ21538.1 transcriptional regulator, AsnC family [Cohaesibacter gelatinilyticus]HAT84798.1 Lrp/AsnC family transcriptional regulator [Hyphomicrobiales bacterium]